MFDRIKKAFGKEGHADAPASRHSQNSRPSQFGAHGPVSEWAQTQGFGFSVDGAGQAISLEGKVGGRAWRLQLGPPARSYIRGEEVRARAELGIDEDVAVLVMNRPLKEALEKRAYQMYTDSMQTAVDSSLPEEMRWLSMFEEVGWDALPREFWDRFSVLTDRRETALAWVDAVLAEALLNWPEPAPSREVPFMILLLNGKAYLRMEYTPAQVETVRHAAQVFQSASESALGAFRKK